MYLEDNYYTFKKKEHKNMNQWVLFSRKYEPRVDRSEQHEGFAFCVYRNYDAMRQIG